MKEVWVAHVEITMKTTAPNADATAPRNTMERSCSANFRSWRKNETVKETMRDFGL